VGVVLERGVIRGSTPALETLLRRGALLIIQQGLRPVFRRGQRDVSSPTWLSGGFALMTASRAVQPLFIIVLASVSVARCTGCSSAPTPAAHPRGDPERTMSSCLGVRAGWVDATTSRSAQGWRDSRAARMTQIGNVGPSSANYIVTRSWVVVTAASASSWARSWPRPASGTLIQRHRAPLGAVCAKVAILSRSSCSAAEAGRPVRDAGRGAEA